MIQYICARLLFWTLAHTSPESARFLTKLLDIALPRLRRIAMRNLEIAYPEKAHVERVRIADGAFDSIARLIARFVRFPQMNRGNIEHWISYEGFENYNRAKQQGRGILIATAHLGNWELSAFAHGFLTEPMNIIIRPLDNHRIDQLVERNRKLSGNRLIEKWDSARSILRALHQNEPVGVLMISHVRYGHMVNRYLRGKRSIARLMLVVTLILLIVTAHRYAIALGTVGYAMAGLISNLYLRARRGQVPAK